jgi:hypothetical protein
VLASVVGDGIVDGGINVARGAALGCVQPPPAKSEETIAEEIKESRFICRSRIPSALLW